MIEVVRDPRIDTHWTAGCVMLRVAWLPYENCWGVTVHLWQAPAFVADRLKPRAYSRARGIAMIYALELRGAYERAGALPSGYQVWPLERVACKYGWDGKTATLNLDANILRNPGGREWNSSKTTQLHATTG